MQPSAESATRARPRIYYGWWLAAIGGAINAVGSVHMLSFSVFFLPISKELHLSRTAISLVFSLARLEGGVEGPVVGWVIDKMGPRFPIALGAFLGGAGYLLMAAAVHDYWSFLFIYMAVISIGFNMSFIQAMHAVANLWFVRYRTRVMSIYSSALRLGSAVLTPGIAWIVLTYGWRTGAVVAGILILGIAFPLALLIRRSPESMGLLPDGDPPGAAAAPEKQAAVAVHHGASGALVDFTLKEALRTPAYWLICFSTVVRVSINTAASVHFVPIFVWKGYSEQAAANMLGLLMFITTGMILFVGWIGDRFDKRLILVSGQMALAVSLLLMVYGKGTWPLYVFVALFAYGEGMAPVNYSILGDYYGRKIFATLRGVLASLMTAGVVMPVFAGWVYDNTESYDGALVVFAVLTGVALVALLLLRRPRLAKLAQAGVA